MTARVACLCVPEIALQILLRDRPAWRSAPVALVAEDRPDAPLVALNVHARAQGLTHGMRHGLARNLVPALHTAVVGARRAQAVIAELSEGLRALSPRVEPDASCAGVFTVDPTGMGRLHRDARAWAASLRRVVTQRGFVCAVVVGFDRRCTRAVALHARGLVVARSLQEERALAAGVPLAGLGLSTRSLRALDALGMSSLGALWSLPAETVRHRFGDEVAELRAWGGDDITLPVQPDTPREPVRELIEVSPPDDDQTRLLFALRGALNLLVARLATTAEAVAAVALTLSLEDRTRAQHRIEPAAPTRDVPLLIELARLRFGEHSITSRVTEVEVTVTPAALTGEQLALFAHDRTRDPRARARAIARVRAAFGEESVTHAKLREAHLPEAGFTWEPIEPAREVHTSAPGSAHVCTSPTPLVRRLVLPPRELAPAELDVLNPVPHDAVGLPWARTVADNDTPAHARWSTAAPSRVSGGWWARTVERDYYYAEHRDGRMLWVYFDQVRARWFLHGIVD